MTRSVPLPTAVVNGEKRFSNARAYGSSDVSVKRSVMSASCVSVRSMRPVPDTARRGDAASISIVMTVAAHVEPARDFADAFVGDEQVADAAAELIARHVERAGAVGVELEQARERRLRIRHRLDAFQRNAPAGRVERVGAVPADERRAFGGAAALPHLDAVDAHAVPLEAQRARGGLERLAVCEPVVDRQRAEPERTLIRPVEVILARHHALDVVVVDIERVLEVGGRPLRRRGCGR